MRTLLAILGILWIASQNLFQYQGNQVNEINLLAKGTLVIRVSTKDGMVVCADKRGSYLDNTFRDDLNKIQQVTPSMVFATLGIPFIEIRDGGTPYNPTEITKSYFAQNEFQDTLEFWRGLRVKIHEEFRTYLTTRPYTKWPETQYPEEDNIFTTLLFFNSTQYFAILLQYIKRQPEPYIRTLVKRKVDLIQVDVFGADNVSNEIISGNNKNLDTERRDNLIRGILLKEQPIEKITTDQAIKFSKKLIRITNEKGKFVGEPEHIVGNTCDCVAITHKRGVQWHIQNGSVK